MRSVQACASVLYISRVFRNSGISGCFGGLARGASIGFALSKIGGDVGNFQSVPDVLKGVSNRFDQLFLALLGNIQRYDQDK